MTENTMTQGALTFKEFAPLSSENVKLTSLNGEMLTMSDDYEFMVEKRAESKRRLAKKFEDVNE